MFFVCCEIRRVFSLASTVVFFLFFCWQIIWVISPNKSLFICFSLWQTMYAEVYQRELARWVQEQEEKEMEIKHQLLMPNPASDPLVANQEGSSYLLAKQESSGQRLAHQENSSLLLANEEGSVELLTNQEGSIEFLTNQKSSSPLLTHQDGLSDLLANQESFVPLLAIQKSASLSLSNQEGSCQQVTSKEDSFQIMVNKELSNKQITAKDLTPKESQDSSDFGVGPSSSLHSEATADQLVEAVSGLSLAGGEDHQETSQPQVTKKSAGADLHENWSRQRVVSGLGIFLNQLKGSGDSSDVQSVRRSVRIFELFLC